MHIARNIVLGQWHRRVLEDPCCVAKTDYKNRFGEDYLPGEVPLYYRPIAHFPCESHQRVPPFMPRKKIWMY